MLDSEISKKDISEAWDYWYPLVYGYFYRRLNNQQDVEDLTSNVLTAFFLAENVENPKGFIWQTAKNQQYKFIDNKNRSPFTVILEENTDFQTQDYAHFESVEENENKYSEHYEAKIQQLIECCKKQLTGEDYNIVAESIIDNKNSTQIGIKYNLKSATVRQKLKRSFSKLKSGCTELWISFKQSENTTNSSETEVYITEQNTTLPAKPSFFNSTESTNITKNQQKI